MGARQHAYLIQTHESICYADRTCCMFIGTVEFLFQSIRMHAMLLIYDPKKKTSRSQHNRKAKNGSSPKRQSEAIGYRTLLTKKKTPCNQSVRLRKWNAVELRQNIYFEFPLPNTAAPSSDWRPHLWTDNRWDTSTSASGWERHSAFLSDSLNQVLAVRNEDFVGSWNFPESMWEIRLREIPGKTCLSTVLIMILDAEVLPKLPFTASSLPFSAV